MELKVTQQTHQLQLITKVCQQKMWMWKELLILKVQIFFHALK